MARQLVLIEPGQEEWRLDDTTRNRGRQGVAAARAALAAARRPGDGSTHLPAA